MISIKRFLGENDTRDALVRVLNLLLQGIAIHAAEGDADDHALFRETLDHASTTFADGTRSSEYLVQVGVVLKAMEDYNRRTSRLLQQRSAELQSMVAMLAKAVQSVSAATEENVTWLKQVEQQIVSVVQIDDVRVLRSKLTDCLTGIRQETERQRLQGERTVGALQIDMQRETCGSDDTRTPSTVDSVTGLRGRAAAEAALAEAISGEKAAHIVVMVVDRIQTYNVTFGFEVGDQVLRNFAGFVRRQLRDGEQAFRWTGPAVVVLVSRPNRIETVRDEIAALMEHKFEHTVRTPTRSIHLPVATRWTVLPMMAAPRLLIHKIDSFIAGPNPQDL